MTDLFLNPLEPKPSKLTKQAVAGTTVRLPWSAGAVCDVKTYLPVGGLPLCVVANAVKQTRQLVLENSRLDGFVPRHDVSRLFLDDLQSGWLRSGNERLRISAKQSFAGLLREIMIELSMTEMAIAGRCG